MKLRYYLGPCCPAGACERPYGHPPGENGYAGHSEGGTYDSLGPKAYNLGCVVCGDGNRLCTCFSNTVFAMCYRCYRTDGLKDKVQERMNEIQKHAARLWTEMFNTRSLDVYGERFQKLLDDEERL